jgi:para-nitrobenzyl esterase
MKKDPPVAIGLAGLTGALACALVLPAAQAHEVAVSSGKLAGLAMADGSAIFYGIPYAAAPAGALRWKPPVAPAPWQGVRDATKLAAACVQEDAGWNKSSLDNASEDCLTLSVRTPDTSGKARLPVYVSIHGGSNAHGDSNYLVSNAMHREGVVMVTVQYRLGVFGFLGLDALRQESPHKASGNYALLDQIAALRWIKGNIARFGGDPSNITVGGNSAGATNALFLSISPLANGLFQKAIIQSSAPGKTRTALDNEAIGNTVLERLKLPHGAKGLEQLRALPAASVIGAAKNIPTSKGVDPSFWYEQQTIDGYVMRDSYAAAYAKGAGRDISFIIGSNTQELGSDRKPEQIPAMIAGAFGPKAAAAMPLYGLRDGKAPADDPLLGSVQTQVLTDVWFRCPANWLASQMVRVTPEVWQYEFGLGAPGSNKPPEHTSENDYIFKATPAEATAKDWPAVQRYWANFIRKGDPNGAGLPHWPQAGKQAVYLWIDGSGTRAAKGLRSAVCDLMNKDNDGPQSPVMPI